MRESERDSLELATPEVVAKIQGRLSFLNDLSSAISESRGDLRIINERNN